MKREQRLSQIVKLIGPDALPDNQRLILMTAEMIKNGFLQQNAYDEIDMFCAPDKQVRILKLIMDFYARALVIIQLGAPLLKFRELSCQERIVRAQVNHPQRGAGEAVRDRAAAHRGDGRAGEELQEMKGLEYKGLTKVDGPIIILNRTEDVGLGDLVRVYDRSGGERAGRIIEISEAAVAVQIFGSNTGLSTETSAVEFTGNPMEVRVSRDMLGRVFDGLGKPMDGYPESWSSLRLDVNGVPINPDARTYPKDFIQTGISCIDGMNTLIRGQKLPIFSGNGLPHNRLAAQIIRQAKILTSDEPFVMVFAAMGVKYDVARFFIDSFEASGVLANVVMYLSLADDPSIERLITPRCALTAAEYLAYECNMHVLVVMTDMTNYCESLREVSTIRGEIPSRKGYPGYLYSDLASLYERAGKIEGSTGSITQIPVLTMPSDDISHPVPDLSGYITEGQIVLDRELSQKGIYPPVAGLPSLSRLMKDGIGPGMTREDHKELASQLFAGLLAREEHPVARVRHRRGGAVGPRQELPCVRRPVRAGVPGTGRARKPQHRPDAGPRVEDPHRPPENGAVQDPGGNDHEVLSPGAGRAARLRPEVTSRWGATTFRPRNRTSSPSASSCR